MSDWIEDPPAEYLELRGEHVLVEDLTISAAMGAPREGLSASNFYVFLTTDLDGCEVANCRGNTDFLHSVASSISKLETGKGRACLELGGASDLQRLHFTSSGKAGFFELHVEMSGKSTRFGTSVFRHSDVLRGLKRILNYIRHDMTETDQIDQFGGVLPAELRAIVEEKDV